MNLTIVPFKKTLNKAYQKVKPNRNEIEHFKANLSRLLDHIDHEESEENVKNHLRDFLNDTWYKDLHLLNTKGRTDLVIHDGKSANSKAAVLFEVKRPKNAAEMISPANGNARAMHEMVLYYLQERIEHNNTDVKYLVITNIYDWYLFDAAVFDRHFYQNKILRKAYEDWKNGRKAQGTTDFFYKEIARPFLDTLGHELSAAYFNIRDFEKPLRNADLADDRRLISLYKIFSPAHLLKQPFANDSNSLDKGFYNELLYLIGLEEAKDGGKKIIRRCAPERQQPGSLLENTIATLETTERWRRASKPGDYGNTKEEQIFGIALELCITWMNRLLFLKLLEAQLVKYHGSRERTFLHTQLLKDFDDLNELFFEVLAKLPEERADYVREKFQHIPYLNSSLFEITTLEAETLFISNLKDRFRIGPMSSTVLKDTRGKRRTDELTVLDYLFAFLDAYDFSSEGSEDIQEENKALINASVLGLIFEKINGYKDGSFFTPGFITMYMAQETVRRAVVQKFNDHYGIACDSFADLKNFSAGRFKTADVLEMNSLVNSLRVCDPAVGSGHFLVSVLNEIIAIKSELGILADSKGERLRGYDARVENDELIVTCNDGQDLFEYRVRPIEGLTPGQTLHYAAGPEAQRVQETLFHEKKTIIENCLFGVDINPNSVKICRLRLWIELLKNTYYIGGRETVDGGRSGLETLPNIDINIKTGNSLISRFALDADLSKALKSLKYDIHTYRGYVQEYHNATDKEVKRGLLLLMEQIKSDFKTEIGRNDPKRKRLDKLASELYHRFTGNFLFEPETPYSKNPDDLEKKRQQEKEKLEKEIEKLTTEIEEVKSNKIYENAFEWRFEFPEVLDAEGRFVGFDVVVGNPPYIRQEEFTAFKPYLQSNFQTYAGTADLLVYFIELGMNLLKSGGHFHFIISNKFMRANFGKALREWMQQYRILEILDFGDLPVFEEATTYPCTLNLQKSAPMSTFLAANIPELETADFSNYVHDLRFTSSQTALSAEGWNLSDTKVQRLMEKLKSRGVPLGEYVDGKIYYGIKTGLNEAFVIDEATKDRLIAEDARSAEVIKPFLAGRDVKRYMPSIVKNFLIFIPWHFPLHQDTSITGASEKAEHVFKEKFPAVFDHLLNFKDKLMKRNKDETGIRYEWYALQRCAATYFKEFDKPKIILPAIVNVASYTFDEAQSYSNDKTTIITVNNKYLLGLLNSRAVDFVLQQISSTKRGGYFEYKPMYVSALPIVLNPDQAIRIEIEALVDQILAQKRTDPAADTSALEREIDELVYKLYELTEEEVAIVEKS